MKPDVRMRVVARMVQALWTLPIPGSAKTSLAYLRTLNGSK
ncbi:MAG: hypothetical protein AVDCRST_MAG93-8393 [uncultured Chloroflexia bacterium]|uniref:Uncharacterized protein n=1 Tax=uncultured Chloroflexia bacterium TaxID=1672391 RepID=A0A6J4MZI1_9CHLR|nr:MAG: hypothetical protein AVDCRST_MAG93-8393 [uncultured Chloroflexia bacterium]